MMKQEFVQHVNMLGNPLKIEDLSDDVYHIVEHVYNYHPAISDKDDIARIWNLPGGFQIIKDMTPTADEWMRREQQANQIREQISKLQKELERYNHDRRAASGRA